MKMKFRPISKAILHSIWQNLPPSLAVCSRTSAVSFLAEVFMGQCPILCSQSCTGVIIKLKCIPTKKITAIPISPHKSNFQTGSTTVCAITIRKQLKTSGCEQGRTAAFSSFLHNMAIPGTSQPWGQPL